MSSEKKVRNTTNRIKKRLKPDFFRGRCLREATVDDSEEI